MRDEPVTPWAYTLIRLLFRFVLKIFYGTIVIENPNYIPRTGKPCIVCANHSNSLTDALLLVTSIHPSIRNMLRLTAKSTQFGRRTFTSWLIEAAGTVPIKRRKDFPEGDTDNTQAMTKLVEALEAGDAVCLFPEGMSRYHPSIAPLKTGVARLVSTVLSKHRDQPDFEVYVLNCSITYMHRQHFRSDVLVTFHPPMKFTPKDNPELLEPVDYTHIRSVTSDIHRQISSGTFDSPSWNLIRTSKLAARIYAPLGTHMSLGDHVRVARTFLEAFKSADSGTTEGVADQEQDSEELLPLLNDLKSYQDRLSHWGIKDDRIKRPLPRHTILYRMTIRFSWASLLLSLSFPGLLLWTPVFLTTFYAVHEFKKTGPIFDTWDEIAQYKLVYGLISGLVVWLSVVLMTLPIAIFTFFAVPGLMWISLRWMEDSISSFRAFAALFRLLWVGKPTWLAMKEVRTQLHGRVKALAISLELPPDPEAYFAKAGGKEKGSVGSSWDSKRRYFSIRRRRKRDWNETLRLYDKVDYPDEGI
ncbi:uncharacterized protein ARMOST_00719 [Armillaria ostoyae]|uniref:Phospholipid/glycerol acyltransferase domain-containing protein n=1 Tax=Armillaria ostoyae TaxID=47428 RepID=A0A284QLX0_ARMOS|nr:uncharacterized protein ARMOST_00719 [Armillaria ostoyae]